MDERTQQALARQMTRAAFDPDEWSRTLRALADSVQASAGGLTVWDPVKRRPGVLASFGIGEAALRSYESHYGSLDPWARRILIAPDDGPRVDSELAPAAAVHRGAFYNEWAKPNGIAFTMAASCRIADHAVATVGLARPHAADEFGAEEKRWLEALQPHLRGAVALSVLLAGWRGAQTDWAGALEKLHLPAIFVDGDGRVVRANPPAEAILRRDDGLGLRRGILSVRDREAGQALAEAIRACARPIVNAGRRSVLAPRKGGAAPYEVLPSPWLPEAGWPSQLVLLIIKVQDPTPGLVDTTRWLAYGFTRAEERLALALVQGVSVREFVDASGRSANTVRAHLKQLFDKTGAHRQADLIRHLLGSGGTARKTSVYELLSFLVYPFASIMGIVG